MPINIFILKSSARIKPYADIIESETKKAISRVREVIPLKHEIDMVVYDTEITPLLTSGYCPSADRLFIWVDLSHPSFTANNLKSSITRTIAHELYHAIRWLDPGYGETLLYAAHTKKWIQRIEPSTLPFISELR